MLLTRIVHPVRLDSHADAGANRDVSRESLLTRRTRRPVLIAGSEDHQSESTSSERPVTLHNFSSGVETGAEGRPETGG